MPRVASVSAMASITQASNVPSTPRRSGATAMLSTAPMMARHAICTCARMGRPLTIDANVMSLFPMLSGLGRKRAARRLGASRPTQLRAQLLGYEMSIDAIANDLRPYEDDQLGPHQPIGAFREEARNLIKDRKAAAAALLPLADKTGEQDGLAACDRDRALDLALRDRRGQRISAGGGSDVADLLLDVEADVAVDINARDHAQNDAGVAIVDGVDDRVVARQHIRAAGRDRHVVADLERRGLIVDDDDGWVRQNLDTGDRVQGIENHARLLLGPDQEIEPGKRPVQKGVGNADRISARSRLSNAWRLSGAGVERRAAVGLEAKILAGQ